MDTNRNMRLNARVFERWNWEHDIGEGEIADADIDSIRSCAIALYDFDGRLMRVYVKNAIFGHLLNAESRDALDELSVYDYFCDADGRIIEKRSLGDDGEIFLIVRFKYDTGRGIVTETAWAPGAGEPPQTIERPITQ